MTETRSELGDPYLLTVVEAARLLGIGRTLAYRLIRRRNAADADHPNRPTNSNPEGTSVGTAARRAAALRYPPSDG